MGNTIGRSRKAKVMKVDGETLKLKTPARANDVVKDYPGHVLLESEAVKHFGLRAKPLEPHHELKPKKIYFLVELPKIQPEEEKTALHRRVRSSGIRGMNAKDRLDLLMLSKRSASDLTLVRPSPNLASDGPMRVKMRLPKAHLDKLMEESTDGSEVAEKIISLYMGNNAREPAAAAAAADDGGARTLHHHTHKPRGKRVSFSPVENDEIHVEAPSQ
ncbi:hypothetical protein PHAVU_008G233900 [Phaseolus vulgaris]|uniref:Plastid movement impaired protein n=1 Tax=Phaseolus vulgaris TaxID=3885 RepID=V7B7T5_PHAVU|nr:hypothetical protein PHAVU_008G233900g [Phaseolus vulgaris]ESW13879.1 hypothetical protein PHAVU_008G233900g [Phaseolus vulgaris]